VGTSVLLYDKTEFIDILVVVRETPPVDIHSLWRTVAQGFFRHFPPFVTLLRHIVLAQHGEVILCHIHSPPITIEKDKCDYHIFSANENKNESSDAAKSLYYSFCSSQMPVFKYNA